MEVESGPCGNCRVRQGIAEGVEALTGGGSTRVVYRRAAGPVSEVPPSGGAKVNSGRIARCVGDFDHIRGWRDLLSIAEYVRHFDIGIQLTDGQRKGLRDSRVESIGMGGSQVCLSL